MKILPALVSLLVVGLSPLAAASVPPAPPGWQRVEAALRAADDERIAATIAGDRARLAEIYSDDLHYSHSNGRADTKRSQIEALVNGASRYVSFEYKERTFLPAAPGIALMRGRLVMNSVNKASGQKGSLDLVYLGVWREENGRWKFLAWQSCRMPGSDGKK